MWVGPFKLFMLGKDLGPQYSHGLMTLLNEFPLFKLPFPFQACCLLCWVTVDSLLTGQTSVNRYSPRWLQLHKERQKTSTSMGTKSIPSELQLTMCSKDICSCGCGRDSASKLFIIYDTSQICLLVFCGRWNCVSPRYEIHSLCKFFQIK